MCLGSQKIPICKLVIHGVTLPGNDGPQRRIMLYSKQRVAALVTWPGEAIPIY